MIWVKDEFVAFVTHAEDKGNFGQIRLFTTRVDKKNDGKKVRSYFSFWSFAGSGYEGFDKLVERVENAPTFEGSDKKMGVMVKIKSYSIGQEPYTDSDGNLVFLKQPRFTVWDWDFFAKGENSGSKDKTAKVMDTPPVVEDNPFEDDEVEEDNPFDDEE